MEATYISISKQMNKDVIHTHTHTHTMEYYSAIKKSEIMLFAVTWVYLEIIILSEVNKKQKDKCIGYHLHVESKM